MSPKSSFLDRMERMSRQGEPRWRNKKRDRYYTWDELHQEIEVFDKRGHHLGVLDGESGEMIKPARKGRKVDV